MKDRLEFKECLFCGRSIRADRQLDVCSKCRLGLRNHLRRAIESPEVQEAKRRIKAGRRLAVREEAPPT